MPINFCPSFIHFFHQIGRLQSAFQVISTYFFPNTQNSNNCMQSFFNVRQCLCLSQKLFFTSPVNCAEAEFLELGASLVGGISHFAGNLEPRVASIGLFWVSFMSFLHNGVYSNYPPHPHSSFSLFKRLNHHFIYTLTQCSNLRL